MPTPSPKAVTTALAQHWDVMERLSAAARDMGTFELSEILRVIARAHPAKSAEEHQSVLQDLSDRGLIRRQPRSDRRQVHPAVLDYVQTMTRERDLGLSEVIKARIQGIHHSTGALQVAAEQNDRLGMVAAAKRLWQQFDAIGTQLDQDRHAILEIAERAKSTDVSLPLLLRYQQVLQAYDQYVDPMVGMMDSGPGGIFHQHLQAAGDALDAASTAINTTHGRLVTDTRVIRDAAYQSRELRRLGREVMNQSSATLLPLRNELRDHSSLASSVGIVMGMVRKRSARRVLTDQHLPFCVRDRYHKLSAGPEILNLMADAMQYAPVRVEFPEEQTATAATPLDIVDLAQVRSRLARTTGTPDLLDWLSTSYPEWQDATVLSVFHDLSRQDRPDQPAFAQDPVWIDLKHIRIQHYPMTVVGAALKQPAT